MDNNSNAAFMVKALVFFALILWLGGVICAGIAAFKLAEVIPIISVFIVILFSIPTAIRAVKYIVCAD